MEWPSASLSKCIIAALLKMLKRIPAYLKHFATLFLKLHFTASELKRKLDFVPLHIPKTLLKDERSAGKAMCRFLSSCVMFNTNVAHSACHPLPGSTGQANMLT